LGEIASSRKMYEFGGILNGNGGGNFVGFAGVVSDVVDGKVTLRMLDKDGKASGLLLESVTVVPLAKPWSARLETVSDPALYNPMNEVHIT
ncbi:MAG TPA: hypothetical protein DEB39_16585, partial [Planctomycetaceae bacterium]|nr:hypothetical protein [Planctomycetaceae bacterium]